jgi:hypothetical protein
MTDEIKVPTQGGGEVDNDEIVHYELPAEFGEPIAVFQNKQTDAFFIVLRGPDGTIRRVRFSNVQFERGRPVWDLLEVIKRV